MSPLLEVKGLEVTYVGGRNGNGAHPVTALREFDLTLERGETVGIVGESGSGKSTAVRAILRLLHNARVSGTVTLGGQDLLSMPFARLQEVRWHEMALVPQSAMNALDPVYSVEDQIGEVVQAHRRLSKSAARVLAREALERVGINPKRGSDYPHQFSGGMRQRVMIALATILEPALLFADEPTTGLDVIVQDRVMAELERVRDRSGMCVVLITHDIPVASEFCDRLVVLRDGRIVETGSTEEVVTSPKHEYTEKLMRINRARRVNWGARA